ncbi:MAG: class I SAM-dependent methyltransferase [Candidatus Lokiarchaeota archaeon]|nr:class I SAM-dependent methyltransferase [Candidatus Lokiarchaeota archaeon]
MKSSIKETFEIIADSYDRVRKKPWPNLLKFMNENHFIGKKMLVLDLGCANGRHTKYLERYCDLSIGIDISFNFLKIANTSNRGKKIQYLNSEITKLPFKDETFSHVLCVASLHHLRKSEQIYAMKEIYRILKTDGWCLFTVWIRDQERFFPILFLDLIFLNFLKKDKNYGDIMVPWRDQDQTIIAQRFYHLFSRGEVESLIKNAGFKSIHIKKFAGKSGQENYFALIRKT